MSPKDVQKTVIVTSFEIQIPPPIFGLQNAGNMFQRMMNQILGDLPFCFNYVVDILIYSPDLPTHVHHLRKVLKLLRLHGLTIVLPKCVFAIL